MQTHKLYRSKSEKMIAGVCGGVGEYFSMDPTLVRLLFAIGAILGGPGVLVYLVMWIVVPVQPVDQIV
jgi:phage shock protein C